MPTYYAARIELHGTPHDSIEYSRLHVAMAQQGFSRTIRWRDGRLFRLPPAEYVHAGNGLSTDQIIERAKAAVAFIGRASTSSAVVHRSDDWNGFNLTRA